MLRAGVELRAFIGRRGDRGTMVAVKVEQRQTDGCRVVVFGSGRT